MRNVGKFLVNPTSENFCNIQLKESWAGLGAISSFMTEHEMTMTWEMFITRFITRYDDVNLKSCIQSTLIGQSVAKLSTDYCYCLYLRDIPCWLQSRTVNIVYSYPTVKHTTEKLHSSNNILAQSPLLNIHCNQNSKVDRCSFCEFFLVLIRINKGNQYVLHI